LREAEERKAKKKEKKAQVLQHLKNELSPEVTPKNKTHRSISVSSPEGSARPPSKAVTEQAKWKRTMQ